MADLDSINLDLNVALFYLGIRRSHCRAHRFGHVAVLTSGIERFLGQGFDVWFRSGGDERRELIYITDVLVSGKIK